MNSTPITVRNMSAAEEAAWLAQMEEQDRFTKAALRAGEMHAGGSSYADIAAELGVSVPTVASLVDEWFRRRAFTRQPP